MNLKEDLYSLLILKMTHEHAEQATEFVVKELEETFEISCDNEPYIGSSFATAVSVLVKRWINKNQPQYAQAF